MSNGIPFVVANLARELYDRFVMGGWEPQDSYELIEDIMKDGIAMSDENDVRAADRAEEQAVMKRVESVITDLTAGKVGGADRHNLGDALERANRNAGVQRAIR